MREYLLIPASDYRRLEKSNDDSISKNQILSNDALSSNVILDIFNRIVKNQRVGNAATLGSNSLGVEDMGNVVSKNSGSKDNENPMLERNLEEMDEKGNTNSKRKIEEDKSTLEGDGSVVKKKLKVKDESSDNDRLSYEIEKIIQKTVPTGYESRALESIKKLLSEGVIKISDELDITHPKSNQNVNLSQLIRMLYVKNASIKGYEPLLQHLLPNINPDEIRNHKIMDLARGGSSWQSRHFFKWIFKTTS